MKTLRLFVYVAAIVQWAVYIIIFGLRGEQFISFGKTV